MRTTVSLGPAAPALCMWKQLPNSRHQLPLIRPRSSSRSRVTLASSCAGTGDYTVSVQRGGNCAFALSQCTQQGEAHPVYPVVTCSLLWVIGGVSECLGISQPVDQVADGCGLHGARHGDATGFDSPGCRAASSGPTVLSLVVFVDLNGIYFFFPQQGSTLSYFTSRGRFATGNK